MVTLIDSVCQSRRRSPDATLHSIKRYLRCLIGFGLLETERLRKLNLRHVKEVGLELANFFGPYESECASFVQDCKHAVKGINQALRRVLATAFDRASARYPAFLGRFERDTLMRWPDSCEAAPESGNGDALIHATVHREAVVSKVLPYPSLSFFSKASRWSGLGSGEGSSGSATTRNWCVRCEALFDRIDMSVSPEINGTPGHRDKLP